MKINNLNAVNFRNIDNINLDFAEKMNVICGENAQGKTNILEALWLFTGAKSFRGANESGFIKLGREKAVTKIEFTGNGVENTAKMEFFEKRTAFLNEKMLKNPSELAGNFNAIIFSPSDLKIINDAPENRRKFLDTEIGKIYPQYIGILRDYTRAVKQRNEIIKEYKFDSTVGIMLDSFENEIAENGKKIINYRKEYIENLSSYLPEIFGGISGGREEIMSVYVAKVSDIMLKESLEKARDEDKFTGTTSVGPHRDDILFKINGINARNFGSQGQKRSVALALKLASAEVIKKKTGEYPVCLLDDVMSELDVNRQNYVLNHISGWQSFITCCEPKSVERLKEGKIIEIKDGKAVG